MHMRTTIYPHSDPFLLLLFLLDCYLYIWSVCKTNTFQVLYKAWNKRYKDS